MVKKKTLKGLFLEKVIESLGNCVGHLIFSIILFYILWLIGRF